jgi:hypothetical protein
MYGPLSAKQLREDAKFQAEQARKDAETRQKLQQQEELHQIKLQVETAKAQQGLMQKEDVHKIKVKEMGGRISHPSLAPLMMNQPTNPEAGPNDTIPAMLAPGEAVIPAESAQHPKNKPIVEALVEEGREMQGYQRGIRKVKPRKVGGKGSQNKIVPKLPNINMKGYQAGTTWATLAQTDEERRIAEILQGKTPNNAIAPQQVPLPKTFGQQGSNNDLTPASGVNYSLETDPQFLALPEKERNRILEGKPGLGLTVPAVPTTNIPTDTKPLGEQLYDTRVPSAEWFTGRNAASPNQNMRARGSFPVVNQATNQVVDVPPAERFLKPLQQAEVPPVSDPSRQVVQVEADGKVTEATPEQVQTVDSVVTALNDNRLFQESIDNFRKSLAATTDEGEKSSMVSNFTDFLSGMFKSIYSTEGPNAMFNEQDLTRFALTFVGGLLTGGSVGGSLRWSGLDVLKQSDGRRVAQAAAMAEQKKDVRERTQSLRDKYIDSLKNTNVPPAIREQAAKYFREAENETDPQIRLRKYEAAMEFINMNAVKDGGEGGSGGKPTGHKTVVYQGRTYNARVSGDGNAIELQTTDGSWVPTARPVRTEAETRAARDDVANQTAIRIAPILRQYFSEDKSVNIDEQSKAYGAYMARVAEQVEGSMSPQDFSVAMENTIRHAIETRGAKDDKLPREEGLRKSFFGHAVIALRPDKRAMYLLDGQVPNHRVMSAVGVTTTKVLEDLQSKNPNMVLNDAVNVLESQWTALPEEVKKKYTIEGSTRDASGFMQWMSVGAPEK